MKALYVLLVSLSLVSRAWSTPEPGETGDDDGIPVFFAEYAIVQDNAFGNKGHSDDLMKLSQLAPKKAQFIAEFWRIRALAEMDDYIQKTVQRALRRTKDVGSEAAQQQATKDGKFILYSYYYDHWEAINKMILASLDQVSGK